MHMHRCRTWVSYWLRYYYNVEYKWYNASYHILLFSATYISCHLKLYIPYACAVIKQFANYKLCSHNTETESQPKRWLVPLIRPTGHSTYTSHPSIWIHDYFYHKNLSNTCAHCYSKVSLPLSVHQFYMPGVSDSKYLLVHVIKHHHTYLVQPNFGELYILCLHCGTPSTPTTALTKYILTNSP